MATTLAEIRAKLQASENRGAGNSQSGGDNAIYPHWNIAEGSTARVRFLPDGNTKNSFFWAERAMIRLPFAGVKGQADSKPIVVQVPCMEMYGEACPVLAEVRPWFKDPSLEEMGRKYWKKKSYVFQGFVRENALSDDKTPENPIRRFTISPQIFNIIKAALMDPEMEELPTDYQRGLDFQIVKTSKGGYADYSTSKWSRKESALTAEEQAAIDAHGLFNLSDFLPKKPTEADLKVIKEMFEASVDGQPYDPDRWAAYYKPYGLTVPEGAAKPAPVASDDADEDTPAPVASAPVAEEPDAAPTAPVTDAKPASVRAEDILAQIRNRQKQ
ncbi:hypothetical protein UFOVP190_119 [uncultured Caudovirales phage]|uniref:Single-stranded DNA-binding protein n=1 Tax=uncultured Caudovirales phage TaxID=2100421 RepID=A0A6J7WG87_9CAUD|nr:hypothetical protein UFOVP190_119 [uncultured Caudovirales phage]